jgi:UDP-N-acetylmuramate: L-alanyl-gamma-D-glutamyl-meso-diaminopimelate ligase
MLAMRGYRVTGSDNQLYEPTASLLEGLAIEVRTAYESANLTPPPDLVVVGNVVPRTNPEAQGLLATSIPYVSMPEALWHLFLRDRRVLMVTGTHGKTTSTALMAHVLAAAGRDPSMLVGGVARDFGTNYRLGGGTDFVIEGDEYDTAFFDKGPKFLHYRADGAIITAVEFDHADIYRDLEHVKSSFRALVAQMDETRVLAVCADFPAALEVSADARAGRVTFGLKAGEFRATEIAIGPAGARFSIERNGTRVARDLELPIGGRMNVANALGVWVLLREFGLNDVDLAGGLASFGGVKRRQEIVGEARGIIVIDDFAHHPTAIGVTLEAIAERYARRRIIAAFEPRSNTARRSVFQDGFAGAFDRATRVYLGAVYFKENDPIPAGARLDTDTLARAIGARGPVAAAYPSTDAILEQIVADARPDDVIVCMSNGPFDGLPQRLVAALS